MCGLYASLAATASGSLDDAGFRVQNLTMSNSTYMEVALEEAVRAAERGEVPVGAVIVDGLSGDVLARAGNRTQANNDPTAHAEILVIREAASKLENPRLENCDLYVTLEPCPMCATAIAFARVRRLYFGAYDPKGGGVDHGPRVFEQSGCHHRPEVIGGMEESQASDLLRKFFRDLR